jgi:hypothetical protein
MPTKLKAVEDKVETKPPKNRTPVSIDAITQASGSVLRAILHELNLKGESAFASRHEILGVVTEEYIELIDAVRASDLDTVHRELEDIAVACIFGIACIKNGNMDW